MSNPFAVAREKCDKTTILDLCEKVYLLKNSKEKSKLTKITYRMSFCVLQNINLTFPLLTPCQILVKLPEICDYRAYKGKQHKLITIGY